MYIMQLYVENGTDRSGKKYTEQFSMFKHDIYRFDLISQLR